MKVNKLVPSLSSTSDYLRNVLTSSINKINAFDDLIDLKKWSLLMGVNKSKINNKCQSENGNLMIVKDEIKNPDHETNMFASTMYEWISADIDKTDESVRKTEVISKSAPKLIPSNQLNVPIITKSVIGNRTRQLVKSLMTVKTTMSSAVRVQELCKHLTQYPEASQHAIKEGAVPSLLRLRQYSNDKIVQSNSRQALTLMGYSDPPKGRGIRILTIDGGGTRGFVIIEMLRYIEQLTGKPIYKLFDFICGVSTGAIIASLVGALQTPIDECEKYYYRFSAHLFKSDFWRGAGRLIMSHAYYDTTVWEKILKDIYGETQLIETAQHAELPRILAISAVVNQPSIMAYLFRNYMPPNSAYSEYEGSCTHKIWEAVRASAAAPGYFEEFRLNKYVHQDGGILINNPTAVAIHEAKMLWPNEEIQCVVSLGSGRYIPPHNPDEPPVSSTSLKTKIIRLIDSATDTEMVHRLMQDLLPRGTYYRLNPVLTEMGTLDENRPEKLDQMKIDTQMYLRKNEYKVKHAINDLIKDRGHLQRLSDWLRMQYSLRFE